MGNAKTTEFLKECLADALLKLLKNKPIEKITVDEISKTADVGRTTFFRNFTSKTEAITFKFIKTLERYGEEHNLAERSKFTLDNALDFFEYNYGMKNMLELVYSRGLQSAVYDALYKIMMPQFGDNSYECYESRFYSYGLFGLLDEWVKRGFNETPEQMAKILYQIIEINKKPFALRQEKLRAYRGGKITGV